MSIWKEGRGMLWPPSLFTFRCSRACYRNIMCSIISPSLFVSLEIWFTVVFILPENFPFLFSVLAKLWVRPTDHGLTAWSPEDRGARAVVFRLMNLISVPMITTLGKMHFWQHFFFLNLFKYFAVSLPALGVFRVVLDRFYMYFFSRKFWKAWT